MRDRASRKVEIVSGKVGELEIGVQLTVGNELAVHTGVGVAKRVLLPDMVGTGKLAREPQVGGQRDMVTLPERQSTSGLWKASQV